MQIPLQKSQIPCLRTVKRELQLQEQTQEIRISDGMPDIGSVICTWGQVILRGKEWEPGSMRVTGGTMIWVLYEPEEAQQPQLVEGWIPFQLRWDLPADCPDGTIMTRCVLKSADARVTSARKLMLRSNVAVMGQGSVLELLPLYVPAELPQDVQLKAAAYPLCIPVEAGEKAFTLEDTLPLPPSAPPMEKLLSFRACPQVTQDKIMNDKLVFRGETALHICYRSEDGTVQSCVLPMAFSQYSELDREYDQTAEAVFWPGITALEVEQEGQQLRIKVGVLCQYRITHTPLITLVEDAYSPLREIKPQYQMVQIPAILERKHQKIHMQTTAEAEALRLVDAQVLPQPIQQRTQPGEQMLELSAQTQALYYDTQGQLQSICTKWEQSASVSVDTDASVHAELWLSGAPVGNVLSMQLQLQSELELETETVLEKGMQMICALELGELREADPDRPSLILQRCAGRDLWQIAKQSATTMDAIRQANDLQTEPEADRWLLIPVL